MYPDLWRGGLKYLPRSKSARENREQLREHGRMASAVAAEAAASMPESELDAEEKPPKLEETITKVIVKLRDARHIGSYKVKRTYAKKKRQNRKKDLVLTPVLQDEPVPEGCYEVESVVDKMFNEAVRLWIQLALILTDWF